MTKTRPDILMTRCTHHRQNYSQTKSLNSGGHLILDLLGRAEDLTRPRSALSRAHLAFLASRGPWRGRGCSSLCVLRDLTNNGQQMPQETLLAHLCF